MKAYTLFPLLALLCGCMSIQEKNAALLQAARTGETATVKRMLDRHADINTRGISKEEFMSRLESRNPELAARLRAKGLDTLLGRDPDTPLLAAIKNRHPETAALLASRGADVSVRDRYGDTPLNLAIKTDQRDTAGLLVSKGANVNAKGALDDTPLHVSIYKGNTEMANLLRSRGADESLLNNYGLNPAEMQAVPEVEAKVVEAAELLTTGGEWTDRSKARTLYDGLKARQDKYLVNALVLRIIRGDATRLQVLLLAIKLGILGSEEKLVSLLMVYGDKPMAEDYLNSGSSLLHDGGDKWAKAHEYHIRTGLGSHRSGWGRF